MSNNLKFSEPVPLTRETISKVKHIIQRNVRFSIMTMIFSRNGISRRERGSANYV